MENLEKTLVSLRNMKKDQLALELSHLATHITLYAVAPDIANGVQELSAMYPDLAKQNEKRLGQCSEHLAVIYAADRQYERPGHTFTNDNEIILKCENVLNKSLPSAKRLPLNLASYRSVYDKVDVAVKSYIDTNKFQDILIMDSSGNIVYSMSPNVDHGININTGIWANTVLQDIYETTSQTAITRFYDFSFYPASPNIPVMFLVSAIFSNDEYIGAVIGVISSEQIDIIMTNENNWAYLGLGETGESYLVGPDHLMRSNSRKMIESKETYLDDLKALDYTNEQIDKIAKTNTSILTQRVDTVATEQAMERLSGISVMTDYMGGKSVAAYSPLNIPYLDWAIIVEMDLDEAEEPIDALWAVTIRVILAGLVLVVFFTLLLSSIITRPIAALINIVNSYTRGDFTRRANMQTNDEVEKLANAFDEMADTIQERSWEILKINASLTEEIEDRKNIEAVLEIERDFVTSVMDSQIFILVLSDKDHKIERTNKRFGEMTGYLTEEQPDIISNIFSDEIYKDAADRIFSTKTPENFMAEIETKTGEIKIIHWVASKYRSISSEDNDFIVWTGTDITAQREAEEQLEDNAKLMESLTRHAQDGILIADDDSKIVSWNESAELMFGYTKDEVLGMDYRQLFNRDKKIDLESMMVEAEGIKKDGDFFPIELSVSVVNMQGRSKSMYIIRDIAQRKQKEEELQRLYEKSRIAEQAKTSFLANMSHEIRTPLNGIVGFLELLKATRLDSTQSDYMKIIVNSAESLLGVINEILDFSKIESGKMHLEEIEFRFFDEFEMVTDLFVAKANEKHVDLILDVAPLIPVNVVGDSLRLKQIMSNLLSNALKFTPENGRIVLTVELLERQAEDVLLKITVTDNGIGISDENQKRIFSAFSQADDSVTRKYGGTGLGLTISARIAQFMGSQLQLKSKLGEGSSFWMDLRLGIGKSAEALPDFNGMKAVVVNYSPLYRSILVKYLNALNCSVEVYDDYIGLKGRNDISVVFVDYERYTPAEIEEISEILPGSARIVLARDTERIDLLGVDKSIYPMFKPINFTRLAEVMTEIVYGKSSTKLSPEDSIRFKGSVLVAEDNPVNQKLIGILLGQLGIDADIVENGQIAYDYAVSRKYDLIFMDIHMPILDGITVTKMYLEWANKRKRQAAPIVALTANVIEEDRLKYVEAGMSDFLAKPIDVRKLIDVMHKYLEPETLLLEDLRRIKIESMQKVTGLLDEKLILDILSEFVFLAQNQLSELAQGGTLAMLKSAALSLDFRRILKALDRFEVCSHMGSKVGIDKSINDIKKELEKLRSLIR